MKISSLEKVKVIKVESLGIEIEAKHWKLGSISINDDFKEVSFTLNLFKDSQSTSFIESFCVVELVGNEDKTMYIKYFDSDVYPDVRTACYQYVLDNVEFFNGATPISQ